MAFNFFKNSETKSFTFANSNSIFRDLDGSSYLSESINSNKFIDYYKKCSPVFNATTYLANSASNIQLRIIGENDEVAYNLKNPLNNPNPFIDSKTFLESLYYSFVLTGNLYLNIISSRGQVIEISNIDARDIIINPNSKDGYPEEYIYNPSNSTSQVIYTRDPVSKRFFSKNKNELIHLMNYNPDLSAYNYCGISYFAGILREIETHIMATLHNYNLLSNGGRPSGILSYNGDSNLSNEQIQKISQSVINNLSGARNAGKIMFFPDKMNYLSLAQNAKDYDYEKLEKTLEDKCYKALSIPAPLYSTAKMTYSNLAESRFLFFDCSVLPLVDRVAEFLTKKILWPHYGDKIKFGYDKSEIDVFAAKTYSETESAFKNGIISRNEARIKIGYDPIDEDMINNNILDLPEGVGKNAERDEKKSEFITKMLDIKNLDGTHKYSTAQILEKAKLYYGE